MIHDFPRIRLRWASPAFEIAVAVATACVVAGGFAVGHGAIRGAVVGAAAGSAFVVVAVALKWGEFGLFTLAVASFVLPLQLGTVLTPVAGIVGDLSLVEIALVVWAVCVGAGAVASLLTSKRGTLDPRRYAVGLCGLLAVVISLGWALTLFAAPASQSAYGLRRAVVCLSVLLLSVRLVDTTRKARILVVAAVVPMAASLGGMFIEQYIAHLKFFSAYSTPGNERFYASYSFPYTRQVIMWATWAGGPAGVVSLVGLTWLLASRSTPFRVTGALVALTGLMVLVSTQTRAAWVATAVALVVLGLLGGRCRLWSTGRAIAVLAASGASVLCLVAIGALSARLGARALSLGALSSDANAVLHVTSWKEGLDMWIAHPLTGGGYGSVAVRYILYEHSAYLGALNGLGPLGFLALGVAVFGIARAGWRLTGLGGEAAILGLQCLCVLTVVLLSGIGEDLTFTYMAPHFWAIWGAAVGVGVCRAARKPL